MIKVILFDLDGVLIDTKKIHFDTLNQALGEQYKISESEHFSIYDGLKTFQKLQLLSEKKGLPINLHKSIWSEKQKLTLIKLKDIIPNHNLNLLLQKLSIEGYKLGVCSNSIRKTVLTVLCKLNIIEYFDIILSNEDINNPKPHPEMYWTAMSSFGVNPDEVLIIEDSPHGLLAASRSGTHVFRINSPSDLTIDSIYNKLNNINGIKNMHTPKWKDEKMNVLIPMAGAGSRFEQAGYTFPKPLIEVLGKPMIQLVVENLNIDANFIYVVRKEHREKYNLDVLLNLITPKCKIVETDKITEGAACTALLAKKYINNGDKLFFANSDQYVDWDSNEFMYKMNETDSDGGILTFKSTHPKWSFAKTNEFGDVISVAEKNPISDNATVGYYYWKKGEDFVKYAEAMINKNIRVNNEFYVCPVFNEAIADNKIIKAFEIKKMWGLGTPEDLNVFLSDFKKN